MSSPYLKYVELLLLRWWIRQRSKWVFIWEVWRINRSRKFINRHSTYHETLMQDCFIQKLTVHMCFQSNWQWDEIVKQNISKYFIVEPNVSKTQGLTDHQKTTAAPRMFSYGKLVDFIDDTLRIAESIILEFQIVLLKLWWTFTE